MVPVSGGKDSHWQVLTCLEHGLTPLAVTWRTPSRTELGARNLENLVGLGVDHIDYRINPRVERKLVYRCLAQYGSTAIPMHMALFAIPLNVALKFGIPLVVWGENSAFEYGSAKEEHAGWRMSADWLRTYGVTQGADPPRLDRRRHRAKGPDGVFSGPRRPSWRAPTCWPCSWGTTSPGIPRPC